MLNYKLVSYQIETDEGIVWVAEYPSLIGVVGTGPDVSSAVLDLKNNAESHINVMGELGMEIPKEDAVQKDEVYSGRITVRTSKSTHLKMIKSAKEEGVSLNAWINEAINTKLGNREVINTIIEEIRDLSRRFVMKNYRNKEMANVQNKAKYSNFVLWKDDKDIVNHS